MSLSAPNQPLRLLTALSLLVSFLVLPWLQHRGNPLVMLDLEQRLFWLFGHAFTPQHLPSLLAAATALASGLYLITHLAGRWWCGFFCPQSVLGLLYLHVQQSLPRAATHALWILTAIITGISFIGYFLPIRSLLLPPYSGWGPWSIGWAILYGLATWANIHYLQRRVCTDLCPFARLQPWISDKHTLHVHYQACRGEPRHPRSMQLPSIAQRGRRPLNPETARDYVIRAANPALAGTLPRFAPNRFGDCTDCGQCVSQCPLHLDIRHGYDTRCLDCGQCQAACDREMAAYRYPQGLIRRQASAPPKHWRQWLRPRTYVAIACLLGSLCLVCALA